MTDPAFKSGDARLNIWAGIGMTACFAMASIMLISGLAGRPQGAQTGVSPAAAITAQR